MLLTCLRHVAELENPTTNLDRNMMPAWTDPQQKNYGRAIRKAVDGGLKQAKTALESGPEVPRDESTMLELYRLVAVDVDDAERCAQTLAAMRAPHAACPTLRMKHLRSRVWRLKTVASPGPSGWRNTHVQVVGCARGGMQLFNAMGYVVGEGQSNARPCRNVDGGSRSSCGLRRCANGTRRASQTKASTHCLLRGT